MITIDMIPLYMMVGFCVTHRTSEEWQPTRYAHMEAVLPTLNRLKTGK